jgi:hypothetical protein
MAPAPLLNRRRGCILDLGYLLHDSKPNESSLNRNMLLNAGASMIDNDSDMLLTTGCVSDSSTPESEEDVLVLSAAAAGAAAVSFYTRLARAELQTSQVSTRLVCSSADYHGLFEERIVD